jgi:hypothetical protein
MIGDWMVSNYDATGRRWDYHLFLDHDGRYERSVRSEHGYERRDTGRWECDEGERILLLSSDSEGRSESWRVLSITTCEDSNIILVLRQIVLASRNLPLLFYRVHSGGRAYGTDWQKHIEDDDASGSPGE